MSLIYSVTLGLIQGFTEFLPISSSGHLIIFREIFDLPLEGSLQFDIFLNTATLLAVIICLWGTIKSIWHDFTTEGFSARSKNLLLAIIVGSIPTGLVGFLYGDKIESLFRSGYSVAWALIAGSVVMFLADKFGNYRGLLGLATANRSGLGAPKSYGGGLSAIKGFVVGCFQTLALISGFSRSGMSISGGLFAGLSREEAIRFSFLLLIPVSLGALLKIILDLPPDFSIHNSYLINLNSLIAFVSALLSGIWSIRFLLRYLSKNSFTPFIVYRIILAIVIFWWL